jgi:hypothetical protein
MWGRRTVTANYAVGGVMVTAIGLVVAAIGDRRERV